MSEPARRRPLEPCVFRVLRRENGESKMLPGWVPPRTNYQTKTLVAKNFGPFTHPIHGTLTIARAAKAGAVMNFTLTLTPPLGVAIVEHCHITADNNDPEVFRPSRMGTRG